MTRFLQVLEKVFSQAEAQAKGNTAMQLDEIAIKVVFCLQYPPFSIPAIATRLNLNCNLPVGLSRL